MNLLNLITPDTTLLTPNRRLTASLLNQYNQLQVSQQKTCWQSLDILPLPSWLQRLWNEISIKQISNTPLLLTANQKSILWEMILRKSSISDGLLQISDTAKLAESAYDLLALWEVKLNHPELFSTEDSKVFQEWAEEFQQLCEKNNWLDNSNLTHILKKSLAEGIIVPPKKIILAGFTEISPQHLSLLKTFEESGSELIHYNADQPALSVRKIGLTDEETEIRSMARWAKSIYENIDKKRPYLIGCVVPRLETLRDTVLQIFSETFTENGSFTLDHTLLPFNISAGKSLLSFPIVKTAIELLKLTQSKIHLESINFLLRSPFIGEAEQESLKRAHFEIRLKKLNVTVISMRKLISDDSVYHFSKQCPALAKRIQNYFNHFSKLNKSLSMSEWARNFIELLKLLGWPGERSLNSQEYQVTERWLNLLLEYSQLDNILKPQHFSQAIEWLTQLSAKTIFQPQSPEAPIQILGMLEAAELPFEHLWVIGLDDATWPAAPKPNPLLPQRLQKMLNMPHATTERELEYSENLMRQLKASAKNVIFSYPEKSDDIHLRPSALLNPIESIHLAELPLSEFISPAEKVFSSQQLENYYDETAPPILEKENIRGGTHIFKQQAACPFKAFAELRLHARFVETPTHGLRPIDRGNIVHKALELVWQKIKDSHTLINMSDTELENVIKTSAEQAVEYVLGATNESTSNKRYLNLEIQRLRKILLQWLKLESTRPSFTVEFQEHEIETTIGNIPVKIRADRIDKLDDGSHLIIDYKTGKYNDIKKFFGERPEEPQLPLYSLAHGENTSAIAFGQVHPDDMGLLGVSKKNIEIKSIKILPELNYATANLWNEQLQQWQTVLENLGNQFLNGIAHVDPKDINTVCDNCQLHTFCRVHEKC